MNVHGKSDALGYLEQLRDALADPLLDEFDGQSPSDEAKQAAARLAVALGYCRLFGIDAGEDDGTLPVPEARGAIESLLQQIRELREQVRTLPERWDDAADGFEAESMCADILEQRMDLWAAMVALGEASLSALIDEDPGAEELSEGLERLMNAIFDLDDEIKQQEVLLLLSTLTETELLENWRRNLVEPYASILPYWLDGTLEDAAEYLKHEFEATVPRFGIVKPEVRASQGIREVFQNLPQPLAVAADAQSLSDPFVLLKWRSPDGQYLARLFVPKQPVIGQVVSFVLVKLQRDTPDGKELPASDLAGTSISLGGVVTQISADGSARMALDALVKAAHEQEEFALRVGDAVWEESNEESK
jgi:hypothetical protein